jgi:signal transduction histidine kinase
MKDPKNLNSFKFPLKSLATLDDCLGMSDSMPNMQGPQTRGSARFKVPVLYAVLLTLFSGIALSEIRAFYNQRDFRRSSLEDARAWEQVNRSVVELFQIGTAIDQVDAVKVDSDQGFAEASATLAAQTRKLEDRQKSIRAAVLRAQKDFSLSGTPTLVALGDLSERADSLVVSVRYNLVSMQNGNVTITPREVGTDQSNNLVLTYNEAMLQVTKQLEKFRIDTIKSRSDSSAQAAAQALWLGWIGVSIVPLAAVLGFMIMRRDKRTNEARARALEEISLREVELRAIARQLTESNRDLQDFAHVASHDLQEPLRKIVAFGDRMRTKHGETMAPEALDYLDRMQSSAARMQTLIQDLLAFSRVNAKSEPFREVDLQSVAQGVASDLEIAVERTGGALTVGELPSIQADPTQMRQLMQNLISNALKFRRPDVAPEIVVAATVISTTSPLFPERLLGSTVKLWCRIIVADNGIGFDEKYLDRIFKVFQRLHGRTEFEGSGIGLSVCRRIAERHNGDITATSVAGQGTTFIITVPVKQLEQRSLLLGPTTSTVSNLVEV